MKAQHIRVPVGKFRDGSKCYMCSGTGLIICPVCYGRKTYFGETCTKCSGIGTIDCPACGGRGVVED